MWEPRLVATCKGSKRPIYAQEHWMTWHVTLHTISSTWAPLFITCSPLDILFENPISYLYRTSSQQGWGTMLCTHFGISNGWYVANWELSIFLANVSTQNWKEVLPWRMLLPRRLESVYILALFLQMVNLSSLTLSRPGGTLCPLTYITAYLQNGLEFGVTALWIFFLCISLSEKFSSTNQPSCMLPWQPYNFLAYFGKLKSG